MQDNESPLHFAAWKGHAPCIQFLVDRKANIEAQDKVCGVRGSSWGGVVHPMAAHYEPLVLL